MLFQITLLQKSIESLLKIDVSVSRKPVLLILADLLQKEIKVIFTFIKNFNNQKEYECYSLNIFQNIAFWKCLVFSFFKKCFITFILQSQRHLETIYSFGTKDTNTTKMTHNLWKSMLYESNKRHIRLISKIEPQTFSESFSRLAKAFLLLGGSIISRISNILLFSFSLTELLDFFGFFCYFLYYNH